LRSSICGRLLGSLGTLDMGGEAYVGFKPGLVDADSAITDDGTRRFLQFVDQFAALVARFADQQQAAAVISPAQRGLGAAMARIAQCKS
jgi:triphosphoribosyl-dephospho-CoA synthetase